jgi:hypothetical protein
MARNDIFRPPMRHRRLQLWIGVPLSIVIVAVAVLCAFLMWAPHRLRYTIDDHTLVVVSGARPFEGRRVVPLTMIRGAETRDLPRARKVYGTNMPGYCAGVFHFPDLGRVRMATDCSRRVVVVTADDEELPIVVSPSDPERFLRALSGDAGYDGGPVAPPGDPGWLVFRIVLPLITLAVAWIVPVVVVLGPARLRYRIANDRLDVRTIARTQSFPMAGCTVRRHRPKITLRWWGTAMPGYYTGWYRSDGVSTRVYATNVAHGILIEGPGLRLFINPERSEDFLNRLCSVTSAVRADPAP